ncbi:aminotransferase class I/II-fold pyridoxal phosphate-dependent enzyme [Chitinophaga lutea]
MIHLTDAAPGRTVHLEGRICLFFSGFSYLGMHVHPAFRDIVTEGAGRYGMVFPSSRIGNLQLRLYEETEHSLAAHTGQQAAACLSSGYLAAQAAIHYAATQGEVIYAPGTHPALRIYGTQPPQGSWDAWLRNTVEMVNRGADHQYVIVSDAVNPLTARVHDFAPLALLDRKTMVLIDDSHGIGVLGPNGEGIAHSLPGNPAVHYLIAASLAKAYSLEGGMIAGRAADIAAIKRHPFFTASTAMMPANAYTWLHAPAHFATARKRLHDNIGTLRRLTAAIHPLQQPSALPMFVLEDRADSVYEYLLTRDSFISSFAYPDPQGARINRAVVSALHTGSDMEILAGQLQDYYGLR